MTIGDETSLITSPSASDTAARVDPTFFVFDLIAPSALPPALHDDNNNFTVTTGIQSSHLPGDMTIFQQPSTQRVTATNIRAYTNSGRTDADAHLTPDSLLGSDGIIEGTPGVARVAHPATPDSKLRLPALVPPTSPNHSVGLPDSPPREPRSAKPVSRPLSPLAT